MSATADTMQDRAEVSFTCKGQATGKMRNDLAVTMHKPYEEHFELATDEGAFHGGDASAPPPLAFFVASLTGCIMTQIRAFAKRLGVAIDDLRVEARVSWDWAKAGRVYETAPRLFEIDVFLDSPDDTDKAIALIEAAKKGCFIEQTLGRANTITHRLKMGDAFVEV